MAGPCHLHKWLKNTGFERPCSNRGNPLTPTGVQEEPWLQWLVVFSCGRTSPTAPHYPIRACLFLFPGNLLHAHGKELLFSLISLLSYKPLLSNYLLHISTFPILKLSFSSCAVVTKLSHALFPISVNDNIPHLSKKKQEWSLILLSFSHLLNSITKDFFSYFVKLAQVCSLLSSCTVSTLS